MKLQDLFLLLLLGALFASAFLFMRVAVPVLGPLFLMDIRAVLAASVLFLWSVVRGEKVRFRGRLRHWFVLGALNAAIPFSLIAWAELHLTASLAAILVATLPLFTALVSAIWLKDALTRKKVVGLILGLIGVAILSGWSPLALSPITVLAILATLVASLSYALGSVYTKQVFQGVPRVTLTIGNFAFAGLLLLPLAAASVPASSPSTSVIFVVLGLVVVASVIPYLLFFSLLERRGATVATSVAFLIPAFGTLLGTVFLAEPLNLTMLAGLGIIFMSISLVTGVDVPWRAGLRRLVPTRVATAFYGRRVNHKGAR